jgi:hypothetical protein
MRPVLRVFAAAALALHATAVSASAQSDSAVRGLVTAAADGLVLEACLVTLTSSSTGEALFGRTGATGWFAFPIVRPGEYRLTVSLDGFDTRHLTLSVEPREIRTLSVALEVTGVAVNVEVPGMRGSAPGTHSPSSTTLTIERLDAMPVFQRIALSDAIVTSAPGMIRGHDDFVHIRGHEVALNPLINGVSFWENTHSVFSAGLSPDVIETANVMTGGFPAEYGNRFGGVIDIVTRSGFRMENRGAATVSWGGAGRRRAGGELGGHRGRFGYFLFGTLFESDRFLSPPDREAIHDSARGAHVFTQFENSFGRLGSIKAVVMGDGTNFEIPKTALDVLLRPLATVRQDTRQQTAIVGWTGVFNEVAVSASTYQRWSRSRLFPAGGPLTVRAAGERTLSTVGGKIDATRFSRRHAWKAGIDAVRLRPEETLAYSYADYLEFTHLVGLPHIHVADQFIGFAGEASGGQVSAYLQDSIQAGSRVTVDVGLRADRFDLLTSAMHASPRVNLAWRVADATVIHASYNHFFVPPPVEGVLSSSAGLTRFIEEIGDALPQLVPIVEDQLEGGVTSRLGPVQVGVTSYWRETKNPVHTTIWPDSRIYSYASFDRARAYGLEAKAEGASLALGITGYLNYALGHGHFQNPVTGGFVTEAAHITQTDRFLAPMDQTHTLTGGLTYRHVATGLWVASGIEFGSGTPIGHGGPGHEHAPGTADHEDVPSSGGPPRVPGHFTANASVGVNLLRDAKRRGKLALQVDVENVGNNVYLIAKEGEFSPSQFSIPRLLSVTAKLRF